ncbi:3'-5' exonuclease Snipper-like isoform X3 [Calliphora vicina]|uniref:3'-5' exonuclease Snipper-like isoform X3 n=1 Tax=Calliphora vicina TaxID=7373 RepID=UPI00325A51C6
MFSSNNSTNSQQPYKYIIAVDFEATCWVDDPHARYRKVEIIEFPAVLMNLETGKIEAEFQQYIRPIEKPILSNFCLNLTGITQATVNNGISLQSALIMFEQWLRRELRMRKLKLPKESLDNKSGNCAFVTWSECDFAYFMHNECQRKRIKKPTYFNQWIDIRNIFINWYRHKPRNFSDALHYVGLKFVGKEHSGLDDAKNTAAFTLKLLKQGVPLKITNDMTPSDWNLNCL